MSATSGGNGAVLTAQNTGLGLMETETALQAFVGVDASVPGSKPPKAIVTVPSSLSVKDTLKVLNNNAVLSVMVTKAEHGGTAGVNAAAAAPSTPSTSPFVCTVDRQDFVLSVTSTLHDIATESKIDVLALQNLRPYAKAHKIFEGVTTQDPQSAGKLHALLQDAKLRAAREPITKLRTNLPKRPNPVITASAKTATVRNVVDLMHAHSVRRVALVGDQDKGTVWAIITLSDILAYLNKHVTALLGAERAQASIAKVPLLMTSALSEKGGAASVVTVSTAAPTYEAFNLMRKYNVSAVGVTDDASGKLVGCIAAEDLIDVDYSLLCIKRIFVPVAQYRELAPGGSGGREWEAGGKFAMAATCTVSELLGNFVNNGLHRVFIVDGDHKPVTIVTQIDMVRLLLQVG